MRVLVATTANTGHFEPLVPFARACAASGHDVRVAAPAGFAGQVAQAGLAHMPFDDAPPEETRAVFASLPPLDGSSPADIEAGNVVVLREVFARLDAGAALPALTEAMSQWRPDLVLRETAELGSYLAAEAAGVPHVQLNTGLSCFMDVPEVVEEPLVELGAVPGLAGLRAAPRLTLVPESLDGSARDGSPAPTRFRETAADGPPADLPDWWPGLEGPLVYVTFGTVAALIGLYPDLYQRVVDPLGEMPVRVLLTTGSAADPAELGELPDNVHAERFWPQRDVMPHAAAMVAHGGLGTTMLALVHGVPMTLLPLFADQPFNAERVAALGAGLVAAGGPGAAGLVPQLLDRVLHDPSFGVAAVAVAREIASHQPVASAVPRLEQLASPTMGR
jgi:UDP:flavonoid glycosyltransferase YjiC (YdhE family)